MQPVLAMPQLKRGQKMAYALDEDEITLAWEAVRQAGLAAGTKVAAPEIVLPAWWWGGTGLVRDDAADFAIRSIPTTAGPSVCVHNGRVPEVEEAARKIHAAAPALAEAAWQKVRIARESPDIESDFPLGAYVTGPRHDEVLAARMRMGVSKVVSWTTVTPGAAPTEFARLQDAVGAYHVAMVAFPDGKRTVGIWTDAAAPTTGQTARPVLRRLFRTQGAWRYGVKFAPA